MRTFTIRTLVRSRTHRMMFAVYTGFALALIMSSALSIAFRNRGAGFWAPGLAMMSMPLIAQFLLLVAIRVIVAIPSEPKARWVFRICEPADRNGAVNGTRDAMLLLVVLPTTGFALLQGLVFWTIAAAVSHAAFTWVVGRLLCELLVTRTGKLPFACTYFPGNSNIFTLWPIYLLAFFFYTVVFAEIDRALSSRPGKLAWFCLGCDARRADHRLHSPPYPVGAALHCGSTRRIPRRSSRAFNSAKASPPRRVPSPAPGSLRVRLN